MKFNLLSKIKEWIQCRKILNEIKYYTGNVITEEVIVYVDVSDSSNHEYLTRLDTVFRWLSKDSRTIKVKCFSDELHETSIFCDGLENSTPFWEGKLGGGTDVSFIYQDVQHELLRYDSKLIMIFSDGYLFNTCESLGTKSIMFLTEDIKQHHHVTEEVVYLPSLNQEVTWNSLFK